MFYLYLRFWNRSKLCSSWNYNCRDNSKGSLSRLYWSWWWRGVYLSCWEMIYSRYAYGWMNDKIFHLYCSSSCSVIHRHKWNTLFYGLNWPRTQRWSKKTSHSNASRTYNPLTLMSHTQCHSSMDLSVINLKKRAFKYRSSFFIVHIFLSKHPDQYHIPLAFSADK